MVIWHLAGIPEVRTEYSHGRGSYVDDEEFSNPFHDDYSDYVAASPLSFVMSERKPLIGGGRGEASLPSPGTSMGRSSLGGYSQLGVRRPPSI